MASFDFIDAAAKGYEFVWKERKYLARASFSVIFVKVACLLAVVVFGTQNMFLRQGLIMLPGYVLEALLITGIIRYALYAENIFIWGKAFEPIHPAKAFTSYLGTMNRIKSLQAGVIVYLLIKVFELAFVGYVADNSHLFDVDKTAHPEPPEPTIFGAFIVMSLFGFMIWLFRFYWIFIPLAMGVRLQDFLKRIAGFESSVYMIGTFLICIIPLILLFGIIFQTATLFSFLGPEAMIFIKSVLRSIAEVTFAIVSTIGLTYGFTAVMKKSGQNK